MTTMRSKSTGFEMDSLARNLALVIPKLELMLRDQTEEYFSYKTNADGHLQNGEDLLRLQFYYRDAVIRNRIAIDCIREIKLDVMRIMELIDSCDKQARDTAYATESQEQTA